MKCMYCGTSTINYSMYVVKKEIKPKGFKNRTIDIGYCCDECYEDKNKKILIKYKEE